MSEKGLEDTEKPGAPVRVYQIINHLDEYNAERCISEIKGLGE